MSKLFERINTNATATGNNRFQMLTFSIDQQTYGINVAKVREIVPLAQVHEVPGQHALVKGIASLRGETMPVIDISAHLRCRGQFDPKFLVVTEFNRHTQAIMISAVDQIRSVDWESVKPPPTQGFLTAVADVDGEMVGILDMEAILAPLHSDPDEASKIESAPSVGHGKRVLVVDDSSMARKQVLRCLDAMGFASHQEADGESAWQHLLGLGDTPAYDLIISDIEMPQLDGYSLTKRIKSNPQLANVPVVLHSSLSGQFNTLLAQGVGAEYLLPKFQANELQSLLKKAVQAA